MTLKKTAAGLLILTMAVTGAACSSKDSTTSPSPAATATATAAPQASAVSQDTTNMKGYIAARIAREKVDYLFAEAKSADGAFIVNPIAATDKETAKKFLGNYFDTSMLDTLVNYYVTDAKAGAAFLTNTKSYFKSNLLDTKKEEITFDKANTADLVKFSTKDGVTYTTKKVNDKFLVSEVQ
ncbi:hypothetical protein A8709_16035 [Paenibacillus pectinilyticus]|uniref:FAS1 domain-containing protein n=1 Tax=Paenibacillus pectinilyticus TaxID=512399 RepID=A0A1C1A511_9BACL|nr:hypothetical protein [Paenibacillus pectinilyticus]OCT15580.1 hypothetical protein A8709_16035 [Paenibacillus pectinilyticus]